MPTSNLTGHWLHYKGGNYRVRGEIAAAGQVLVVYASSDGRIWLRPKEMWQEHVSAEGYSGPRFRRAEA